VLPPCLTHPLEDALRLGCAEDAIDLARALFP